MGTLDLLAHVVKSLPLNIDWNVRGDPGGLHHVVVSPNRRNDYLPKYSPTGKNQIRSTSWNKKLELLLSKKA
jgi:hypothetical protein